MIMMQESIVGVIQICSVVGLLHGVKAFELHLVVVECITLCGCTVLWW